MASFFYPAFMVQARYMRLLKSCVLMRMLLICFRFSTGLTANIIFLTQPLQGCFLSRYHHIVFNDVKDFDAEGVK